MSYHTREPLYDVHPDDDDGAEECAGCGTRQHVLHMHHVGGLYYCLACPIPKGGNDE